MNNDSIRNDPAFSAMTIDILNNTLSYADNPGRVVEYLAEEVRELTGARCIVFTQYRGQDANSIPRIIGVNPPRYRDWAQSPGAERLYEIVHDLPQTQLWHPEAPWEASELLCQTDFGVSIAVPLNVGEMRVGAMLVLGLPDEKHIETEINLLSTLSTVVALVLRNAFLFANQEQIIEERTKELTLSDFTLDNMTDAMYWINPDSSFWKVNQAACKMLGYSRDELLKLSVKDVDPVFPIETWPAHWGKRKRAGSLNFETVHRTKDGRDIPVEITASYVEFNGKEYDCAMARDLTERKKMEEQLRQSQKMEAVGHLAGGIAHDFNNILTVIGGYGALLQRGMAPADPQKEKVAQILAATERAANLTSSLLAFSRKQVLKPRTLNLNGIVQNVGKFLLRIIGEDIQLSMNFKTEPLYVHVDSGQIEQVLMNLASNARDAMPNGGILTIETDFQQLDASFVKAHGLGKPGPYALVSVIDNGCGMDEESQQQIFEPFFTTKEVGRGTGLGLAVAYGIIQQHNGFINVYSEQEKGTIFRIYIPAVIREQEGGVGMAEPAPPQGGTETILVAEDDSVVRELVESILGEFGYTVILAEDGQDAVEKFRASPGIHLILMDMIMPRRSGKEAYDEIRQFNPGVKVLFYSGYTAGFLQGRAELDEGLDLVMKPVQPMQLLGKIREILDRK